jgi:hypothetical protein
MMRQCLGKLKQFAGQDFKISSRGTLVECGDSGMSVRLIKKNFHHGDASIQTAALS